MITVVRNNNRESRPQRDSAEIRTQGLLYPGLNVVEHSPEIANGVDTGGVVIRELWSPLRLLSETK